MGDLKARIRATFSRRNSAAPSLASSTNSDGRRPRSTTSQRPPSASHASQNDGSPVGHGDNISVASATDDKARQQSPDRAGTGSKRHDAAKQPLADQDQPAGAATQTVAPTHSAASDQIQASDMSGNDLHDDTASKLSSIHEHPHGPSDDQQSSLTDAGAATSTDDETTLSADFGSPTPTPRSADHVPNSTFLLTPNTLQRQRSSSPASPRPDLLVRRQSLLPHRQTSLIRTLLTNAHADELDLSHADQLAPISATMVTRKIWVRRPGGSATLVTINEEDVVDDVRDMILHKYANSLGRQFDSPDLTIRIVPREQRVDRTLGPEEPMGRTLDAYFPGGQTVDEALIIDVPLRRTPRASPRTGPPHAPHITSAFFADDLRPSEAGTDYFGPGVVVPTHVPVTVTGPSTGGSHHAISVIATGQVPQLPSPGGTRSRQYRDRPDRPRLGRQHTSSPTIINMVAGAVIPNIAAATNHGMHRINQEHSDAKKAHPAHSPDQASLPPAPPLPTPPAPEPTAIIPRDRVATPPPITGNPQRVSSPRPTKPSKKSKKNTIEPLSAAGTLGGSVPPINVLIVEDNIINLKLLEAFVKRLKVRWATAMNGRDAVVKWRAGGFHLVLMDIQLPIMSGLDATREIRRLEKVNSIGVFSSSNNVGETNGDGSGGGGDLGEGDRLGNLELFKSPVIIVALTASSLQSDRHEALAAGCNDFLTKPVNFVWLERKVMEWGCMQALIDFDGWRKWKDFSQKDGEGDAAAAASKKTATKAKKTKNRQSLTAAAA